MKNWKLSLSVVAVVAMAGQVHAAGNSASATAKAKITVKKKIKIEKQTDLNFADAYTGDAQDVVAPNDPNGRNAEFIVTGREGAVFVVDLPGNNEVKMKTGAGNTPQTQIAVNGFTASTGGDGSTGVIEGETTLTVGATRAAILEDQVEGAYEDVFTVGVSYQ